MRLEPPVTSAGKADGRAGMRHEDEAPMGGHLVSLVPECEEPPPWSGIVSGRGPPAAPARVWSPADGRARPPILHRPSSVPRGRAALCDWAGGAATRQGLSGLHLLSRSPEETSLKMMEKTMKYWLTKGVKGGFGRFETAKLLVTSS